MANKVGAISIPGDANILPHEMSAARLLARRGSDVTFLRRSEGNRVKTPDLEMNGIAWELKSPQSKKLDAIERNLRRASKQSRNVILDVRRMHGHSDEQLEKRVRSCLEHIKGIDRLLLIRRDGVVVDVKR